MAFNNLPGVFPEKIDGGLAILASSNAPRVVVLGTADKGFAETPYLVGRTQEAAVAFGSGGTLIRGMYEAKGAGAENVILFRMGATPAILEGLGVTADTGGIRIETALKDDSVNDGYELYFDKTSSAQRLVIRNVSSGTTVYDRSWANEAPTIDRGEVYVSGDPTNSQGDNIGSASEFLTLTEIGEDAVALNVTFTAGTDGTSPSRMKLFELLFASYRLLENQDFDIVVPMDVYLDDLNVIDMTSGQVTTRGLTALDDYPEVGSDADVLGKVYVEEYQGEFYFWWWFPADPATPVFADAQIFPAGVGSADSDKKIDGTALVAADFHEVNFAYQLADFCYRNSENNVECIGVIGVRPPVSVALKDVSQWVGTLPTYVTDSEGAQTISGSAYNGTGLLGNKFLAGKYGFRASVAGGGFIATDTGFVDGAEQEDRGGHVIDIGKYISIVGGWVTLFNSFDTTGLGYISTGAPTYAGFVASLDSKSAPTNKVINSIALPFRLNNTKLDQLAGVRYVFFQDKPKGTVISDAPTAARPDSDYQRLTTVRIVKDIVDGIRTAADPFIGEAGTDAQRAALQTACEGVLGKFQKGGYISRYDMAITATPAQRVAGDAVIELTVVPAFELRQITLIISLAAV